MGAKLTRIDPAVDILAPHSHECIACGHPILDQQAWATFRMKGLPEGRVHRACWDEKGAATVATEYRNRCFDAAGMPRPASMVATVVH